MGLQPQTLNASRKRSVNLWRWKCCHSRRHHRCRSLIKKNCALFYSPAPVHVNSIKWPDWRMNKIKANMTNQCEVTIIWLVTNYDYVNCSMSKHTILLNYSQRQKTNRLQRTVKKASAMGTQRTCCYTKLSCTSIIYITFILLINSIQCITGKCTLTPFQNMEKKKLPSWDSLLLLFLSWRCNESHFAIKKILLLHSLFREKCQQSSSDTGFFTSHKHTYAVVDINLNRQCWMKRLMNGFPPHEFNQIFRKQNLFWDFTHDVLFWNISRNSCFFSEIKINANRMRLQKECTQRPAKRGKNRRPLHLGHSHRA